MSNLTISSLRGGCNSGDPSLAIEEDQCLQEKTTITSKVCTKCKLELPIESFYFHVSRQRHNSWCRQCHSDDANMRRKTWSKEKNQEYLRKQNLKHKFNITIEEYETMFRVQNGKCAICRNPETALEPRTGLPKRLAVDHDKSTGKIRELLCTGCNTGIGNLKHDIHYMANAIAYLEKHQ